MDQETPGDLKDQEGNETRVGWTATVRPQMRQRDRKQTYKKQKSRWLLANEITF